MTHLFNAYAIISRAILLYQEQYKPGIPGYQIEVKEVCQDKIDFKFDIKQNNKNVTKYKTNKLTNIKQIICQILFIFVSYTL